MPRILTAIIAALLLSACTAEIKPPSLELSSPLLHLGGHGGHHCPPGLAMQGRC